MHVPRSIPVNWLHRSLAIAVLIALLLAILTAMLLYRRTARIYVPYSDVQEQAVKPGTTPAYAEAVATEWVSYYYDFTLANSMERYQQRKALATPSLRAADFNAQFTRQYRTRQTLDMAQRILMRSAKAEPRGDAWIVNYEFDAHVYYATIDMGWWRYTGRVKLVPSSNTDVTRRALAVAGYDELSAVRLPDDPRGAPSPLDHPTTAVSKDP